MAPTASVNDLQLLQRFVAARDAGAFAILVRRHIEFVHAAARRQTGDSHLADDVTQAVFIVLARKAATIRSDAALAGWLFSVTRHAAQNAMKMQARAKYYESRAAAQRPEMTEATMPADDLRPMLDEAIARLPRLDQSGVVLHFFQHRTFEDVGAALGLSAEAARKRVSRALEKMRGFLAAKGAAVGATALVATLKAESASATAAPLVQSTINVAMLSTTSASADGASMLIAKGVSHMFTLAKIKTAAVVALCATGVTAAAVPLAGLAGIFNPSAPAIVSTSSTVVFAEDKFTAKISDNLTIEFMGVAPFPGDDSSWFSIAGQPIERPVLPGEGRVMSQPSPEFQTLIRSDQTTDAQLHIFLDGAQTVANMCMRARDGETESAFYTTAFTLGAAADSLSLRIGVAEQPWKALGSHDRPEEAGEVDGREFGVFRFNPVEDETGDAAVAVDHEDVSHEPHRVIAVDDAGTEHECGRVNVQSDGQNVTTRYRYSLPPDKVKKFVVQGRKFNKWVEVSNISLAAGQHTEPKIVVKDVKE